MPFLKSVAKSSFLTSGGVHSRFDKASFMILMVASESAEENAKHGTWIGTGQGYGLVVMV